MPARLIPQSDDPRIARDSSQPERSAAEQAILDAVTKSRGREWTAKNAERILQQARDFGDL